MTVLQIIDEIGHCAFDKENTRLFFDLIDRRYNKEGNFNMIFTSNKNPALWREDFDEDATLLCALDRIFEERSWRPSHCKRARYRLWSQCLHQMNN